MASQRRERGVCRHNRGRNESGCLQQCLSDCGSHSLSGCEIISEWGLQRFGNSLEVSATVRSLR